MTIPAGLAALAQFETGIPVVRNAAERDARFPNPPTHFRVYNLADQWIQRWTGATWQNDILFGAVATGTPSLLWNGVAVIATPQAFNFTGAGVDVNADDTPQGNIVIPGVTFDGPGPTTLVSMRKLVVAGSGVAATVNPATGQASLVITAGGGIAFLVNGAALGPIASLDVVGQGVEGAVVAGAGTLTLRGAARASVPLVTAALDFEEFEDGTVEVGALTTLLSVASDSLCWLRLYSTAADRTADAARAVDEDPTTPIVLDLLFTSVMGTPQQLYPIIQAANLDVPPANVLYYRVQQLTITGGAFAEVMSDLQPGDATEEDLNGKAITDPQSSGATTWVCDPADAYFVTAVDGGILPQPGTTVEVARIEGATFDHAALRMRLNIFMRAIDNTNNSAFACFYVPSDAIPGWDFTGYIRAGIVRASASTATAEIVYVTPTTGAEVNLAVGPVGGVPLAATEEVQVRADLAGGTLSLYRCDAGTGANPVLQCAAIIDPAILALIGANDQVGFLGGINLTSGGYQLGVLAVEEGMGVVATPVALDILATRLEEAP